jgi:hypothetical protein
MGDKLLYYDTFPSFLAVLTDFRALGQISFGRFVIPWYDGDVALRLVRRFGAAVGGVGRRHAPSLTVAFLSNSAS